MRGREITALERDSLHSVKYFLWREARLNYERFDWEIQKL